MYIDNQGGIKKKQSLILIAQDFQNRMVSMLVRSRKKTLIESKCTTIIKKNHMV